MKRTGITPSARLFLSGARSWTTHHESYATPATIVKHWNAGTGCVMKIGGIFGNIDLALKAIDDGERVSRYLGRGIGALERAKDLTQQLLTFSKGGAPRKKQVDISRVLEQSQQLSLSGSSIDYSINIAPEVSTIEADDNQLCQVFNNVMINARQAMPSGGKLQVSVENCTVKTGEIHGLESGEFLKIAIKDDGVGIPDTLISKIFDPFFTTKDTGSGLGMSTSYSIVRKHDGVILIDSQVGAGTTVTIYLPAGSAALATAPDEGGQARKIGGRILVMDDEEVMRDVAQGMLELLGFDVVCTRDGEEAIDVFREYMNSGNAIDIVLLDLTIPGGMGGEETMRAIREIDKSVAGIVASGYADSPVLSHPEQYGFAGKMEKPYRSATLAKAIEEALTR
ncbi:MAG: response regulator [Chitinivibrionales bacterium]|nr:response regulator [Chitinivibrionales bacterium]